MKNISKSIRLDQSTFDYIMSFDGNGFNEKLANLVRFCMVEEEQIKRKIEFQQEIFNDNQTTLGNQKKIIDDVNRLKYALSTAFSMADDFECISKTLQLQLDPEKK